MNLLSGIHLGGVFFSCLDNLQLKQHEGCSMQTRHVPSTMLTSPMTYLCKEDDMAAELLLKLSNQAVLNTMRSKKERKVREKR